MKSIRIHEHGGIEKLIYEDAPEPVISSGNVIINVKACALNHLDIWVRQGLPNADFHLPRIPGSDISELWLKWEKE